MIFEAYSKSNIKPEKSDEKGIKVKINEINSNSTYIPSGEISNERNLSLSIDNNNNNTNSNYNKDNIKDKESLEDSLRNEYNILSNQSKSLRNENNKLNQKIKEFNDNMLLLNKNSKYLKIKLLNYYIINNYIIKLFIIITIFIYFLKKRRKYSYG
jgi:hypothetical protein